MEYVSLALLFFISLPQAALSLEIINLLMGKGENSNPSIKNVLRSCTALAFMLLVTYVITQLVPNVHLNSLGQAIAYILILKAVYNYKWKGLIISVLLWNSTLIVIQDLYIPYVLIYMGVDMAQLARNTAAVFYLSLPARFAQMGVIVFLKKFYFLIDFAKARKYYYPLVYILIALNLAVDVLSNLCVNYYKVMAMQDFMAFVAVIYVLIALYCPILVLVDKVAKGVMSFSYSRHISVNKEFASILKRIEKLIDENDVESAKKFIGTICKTKLSGKDKERNGGDEAGSY